MEKQKCRVCGCTDLNCSQCIEKTGKPCYWVEEDLCSACKEISCPICGLDGFENQDDLDIHLEDCKNILV